MTKTLALATQTGEGNHAIVRGQLKATQAFVAERLGLAEKPLELMDLPYDVRYIILEHLTDSQYIGAFLRGNRVPLRLPEAARVGNIQLRRECLLVALKMCTISIHGGPGNAALQAWLSKIDLTGIGSSCETGYDAITSLTFPYFSRFPYRNPSITKNNDIGLALACRNLRVLSLSFHCEELAKISCRHSKSEAEYAVNCALDIRKSYQLDGLLGATKLEKIHFEAGPCYSAEHGLTEVAAWLEKGFHERGKKVVVEIY
jgi:hypothetical protein